ncbi:MAG: carbon-nitrogen hydrolase family protein [Pseudomonadota bacterium]
MKAALLQLNSSDQPAENLTQILALAGDAVARGAEFVLTPEVTNCVSTSRRAQSERLVEEEQDTTLAALREFAGARGVTFLIGSLALKTKDPDGRFANRSFLIGNGGQVLARYDKIHMFDVEINEVETYRESEGYRPGEIAVVAETSFGRIGMAICYDLRFPLLSSALAAAGAGILTYPSAFSPVSGAAHWHALLRARAIETGCWVIAPAQTGLHPSDGSKQRSTYGHSLVVDPWGQVVLDAGVAPGVYVFDLDMEKVAEARRRIPSLANARPFQAP